MVAGQAVSLLREGEDGCCCGGDWARKPLLSTISQCTGRNPPSRGKTASQLLSTGSVETPLAPLGAAAPSSGGATPHSVLRTGPTVLGGACGAGPPIWPPAPLRPGAGWGF